MWLKSSLSDHEKKIAGMSREEYTKYMLTEYPEMFGQYYKPMTETCMCWGFDIGSGWGYVLDNVCRKLKAVHKATGVRCVFTQVKEKFGGARFYHDADAAGVKESIKDDVDTWFDIVDDMVSNAEEYCDYVDDATGETCNPKDKIQVGTWLYGCTFEGYIAAVQKYDTSDESKEKEIKHIKEVGRTRDGRTMDEVINGEK